MFFVKHFWFERGLPPKQVDKALAAEARLVFCLAKGTYRAIGFQSLCFDGFWVVFNCFLRLGHLKKLIALLVLESFNEFSPSFTSISFVSPLGAKRRHWSKLLADGGSS